MATFAVLGLLIVGGVVLTTGALTGPDGGATASGGPAASGVAGASGGTGGGGTAAPSLPASDAVLTAQNLNFLEKAITAPAGKAFTLAFDNLDAVPHNVEVKDASGASVFKGAIFSGPGVKVYDVPALAAGQYPFACTVHPNMTGTITVQ
jgi:plastocyanin